MSKKKNASKAIWVFVFSLLSFCILIGLAYKNNLYKDNVYRDRKPLNIVAYKKLEMKQIPLDIIKEFRKSTASAIFKIPILIYHYVEYVKDEKDTIRKSLNIMPFIFENQIKTLLDNQYIFITMSDLADALDGKAVLPRNSVILTFDDGYEDFYQDVLPILKKYKIRATAYVVSRVIGKLNYMNEKELEGVRDSGLVEIGAHTMHHAYLKGQSYDFVKEEIEKSRTDLEQLLKVPVVSFAYPYGAFDKQAISLVKDAGFNTAVTTVLGNTESNQNRFFIYRIRPGVRIGKTLIDYLNQDKF